MPRCTHLESIKTDEPSTDGCEECLATGDTWVRLRKNKHATKHFKKTGHPVITSLEPGEGWRGCYVDELDMELE